MNLLFGVKRSENEMTDHLPVDLTHDGCVQSSEQSDDTSEYVRRTFFLFSSRIAFH